MTTLPPMTTYAHHPSASSIVATWPTGAGSVADRATRIPAGSGDDARPRHLAQALDRLSERIWIAYEIPDATVPDPVRLAGILRRPHLPVGGMLRIAEDDLDEAAHAVGRLLAEIDDRGCREAIVREVETECAAVRSAIDGDLTGRAQQAVTRIRPLLDRAQYVAAHELLHEIPMGSEKLFTDVAPVAACLAALEWLGAGAVVAAHRGGYESLMDLLGHAQVVTGKDLRVVVALFEHPTADAAEVVFELLREAVFAATGCFLVGPEVELDEPPALDDRDPGDGEPHDNECRALTTLLDPGEPGRALLEGILTGIQTCFEVYLEDTAEAEVPDPDPRLTGPHWSETVRQRFDAEVRDVVAAAREALRE